MSLREIIYNELVRKNENVRREYEKYVIEHLEDHKKRRVKHWKILWELNWHYRVKGAENSLLYEENKIQKNVVMQNATKIETKSKDKIEVIKVEKKNEIIKNVNQEKSKKRATVSPEIKVKENGGVYIDIEWKKLEGVQCYNIYISEDKKTFKFSCKVYSNACRIERLKNSSIYYIKIKYSLNGINYKDDLEITEVKTRPLNKWELFFGVKRAYADGSESSYRAMMNPMNMAKGLMPYDVISFDIFDTLILRPFKKPSDLFILVGTELDIMDFCEIRIKAENEARQYAKMNRGNTEVTIDDIYEIIEKKTGIPKEKGIETEFNIEMNLCFANPYMKRVFELLKYQNKEIIICSDMYYPAEMLGKILKSCGYEGFSKIYVSCEYNCTKRNGGMYEILKEKYYNLVHIGDNQISDIESAGKAGIPAIKYYNVNERGEKFRAENMSHLVGSAYCGLVNSHLHNGIKQYSPYYEMGFIYAGIYVFGFCHWIHEKTVVQNIDKVLFLAREGDIYKKVYEVCFPNAKSEYTLWSRVPVAKTVVKKNRHPYLLQLVHHKANAIYKSKITTLFTKIGIEPLLQYLKDYRVNEDEYLTPQNEKIIEQLMVEHWDEICECYENDLEKIKKYLKSLIGNSKHIAVVDVGWSGNNVLQIKYLVEEVFKMDCKVTCLLAATRNVNETYMVGMMQDKQVDTYIFSNMQNKFLHDYHQNTNKRLNSFFFEIMTQSATPTFLGFEEDKLLFDIPEIENYEFDKEIHRGILDFSILYKDTFKKYPYMYNICGSDAYMPFRMLVSDLTYLKKYFSDFVFGRDLFATQEKAVMETVGEVIAKEGL